MSISPQEIQEWDRLCLDGVRAAGDCAAWCIQHDQDGVRAACIRACLDLAALAGSAARLMARDAVYARTAARSVFEAARACAAACAAHVDDHDSVRRCEHACRELEQVTEALLVRQT